MSDSGNELSTRDRSLLLSGRPNVGHRPVQVCLTDSLRCICQRTEKPRLGGLLSLAIAFIRREESFDQLSLRRVRAPVDNGLCQSCGTLLVVADGKAYHGVPKQTRLAGLWIPDHSWRSSTTTVLNRFTVIQETPERTFFGQRSIAKSLFRSSLRDLLGLRDGLMEVPIDRGRQGVAGLGEAGVFRLASSSSGFR